MRKFEFEVEEHEGYGELGFKPKWFPGADPLAGMAVAHDILEHGSNEDGSTEHELRALGASMFIRGDGGYYNTKGLATTDESEHISSDFPQLLQLHEDNFNCREIMKCPVGTRDVELWVRAAKCVDKGIKLWKDEVDEDYRQLSLTWAERDRMVEWLCDGYKRAARKARQNRLDAYSVAHLFYGIERDADDHLKFAEPGMIYTVRVSYRQLDFQSTLEYPDGE